MDSPRREVPTAQHPEPSADNTVATKAATTEATVTTQTSRTPRIPPAAWLIAGAAIFVVSVLVYGQLLSANPTLWGHSDEYVYRAAGLMVRKDSAHLYSALFGEPNASQLAFTYPPFAALMFALGTPFSFATWQVVLVVVNISLLPVIFYASLRISGPRGMTGAALAFVLAAAALWVEPVYMTMYFGQINLILLAFAMVDLALPDSCRWKGIGVGIAAGMKLTPLIFIPFLLGSRRIRAGLVALATFVLTVVIGFVVLPTASRAFWTSNLSGRPDYKLQNQSIAGVLERLFPAHLTAAHHAYLALAFVVGVTGLAIAVIASRRGLELLAIVATSITGLLISPISWTHHWVWALIPGLALMAAGARRAATPVSELTATARRIWITRAAGLAALLVIFGEWPRPSTIKHVVTWLPAGFIRFAPHDYGQEYHWHGWELLVGNMYVILGAVALAAVGGYLWVTRTRTRPQR